MAGSSAGTFPTSSDGTYGVGNMEVEEDIAIIEESLIAIIKEEDTDIKQEEIPEDIPLSCIKSEPDEVSYACVCLLLDTFYHCPEMSVVCVMSVFMASCNRSTVGDENGFV
jgi:hypothetical protein